MSFVPVTTRVTTLATLCALPAVESSVAVYSNVIVAVSPSASASKLPTTSYVPVAGFVMVTVGIITAALSVAVVTFAGFIWNVCVSVASKSSVNARVPW